MEEKVGVGQCVCESPRGVDIDVDDGDELHENGGLVWAVCVSEAPI